ncbi:MULTISPECIES: phage tail protein [unclassified Aureispira]|uniref:phage tail protein n=1 Tax=unclassified Aureispira TaxID=2649989 RepID=UPI0009E0982E|nr:MULTISPECIES: phage tail protein [unclassified Aureispira]WMX14630.1 phage tail protein [Aureispira sp. CCB-E]
MDLLSNIVGFMNEPIPSFFFEVLFFERSDSFSFKTMSISASLALQALDPMATAFSDVQGLKMSFATTPLNEAGWSTPRPSFDKIDNDELVLQRYLRPRHIGVMGFSLDPTSEWCQKTMSSAKTWEEKIEVKDIMICIYHPMIQNPLPIGPSSFPVAGFLIHEAFPTSWEISDLSSTSGDAPIKETIKFKYTEIERLEIPPS